MLSLGLPALSQNRAALRGSAVAEAGEEIDFYTLYLLSPEDSSIVTMDMFFEPEFQFADIKPQTYILLLKDVQYQSFDTLIRVSEGMNVLDAPIALKPAELGEVTVRASRPLVSHRNGNFTLDVGHTRLQDERSMGNLLARLPGVVVNNEEISLFGKDKLLIYINDRQVRSQDEIKSLTPTGIDRIEVIHNVGSEYDADVDAVIKIKTRDNREERIHVSVNDNMELAHYVSNSVNLALYLNHNGKFTQYLTWYNDMSKGRQYDKSHTYTRFGDYRNLNFRDVSIRNRNRSNNLFYSLKYLTDKNGELGFQYSGNFSGWRSYSKGAQHIYHSDILAQTVHFDNDDNQKKNSHNFGLNYRQAIGAAGELSLAADYVIHGMDVTNNVYETSQDGGKENALLHISDGDYRVISISPEYKATGKKFSYSWGMKYSSVTNHSAIEYRPSMNLERHQLYEYTAGAYMTFDAKLSFIDIKSGIRLEYTDARIQSGNDRLTRDYLNLFPSITLSRKVNGHLSLSAYGGRRIQRPSFSNLNPQFIYKDSLTYVAGNPQLKPTLRDDINLNVNFYRFNFMIGYTVYRNSISTEDIPDSTNPDITISTYGNMKNPYRMLAMSVSHSFNHPVFSNMSSLNYQKPDLSITFNNETLRLKRPIFFFQTSGNLNILKNTSLDYSFFYKSSGDVRNLRYKSVSNLSAGLSHYLMNRKMMLSLSVEDILNRRKTNRWTSYSNNVSYTMDSSPDTRSLVVTLRYNWGVSNRIQKKTSDTDNINRLP
jgi:hypothetical protein